MNKFLAMLLALLSAAGAQAGELPRRAVLAMTEGLRDANFHLFRALESPQALAALDAQPALSALRSGYRQRLRTAMESCGEQARCFVNAARWTGAEVAAAENALRGLCNPPGAVHACRGMARALRDSGVMIRFAGRSDGDLLGDAWRLSATSIEHVLATYGEGKPPRYPAIDSMSHDPASPAFGRLVRTATRAVLESAAQPDAFFTDGVRFALLLLQIDGRDEAARFQPLESGENRAAFRRVRQVRWKQYPYSVILVPGSGPEDPAVRLSAEARMRLDLAAARYRQNAAPFIVVSGGYVHPARTPFCEALEMKRALMEDFGIPGEAILIEPHARHTTTNLRNTARIMYRYGLPFERKGLIVTDERQAAYILSAGFDDRNRQETGIVPYRSRKQRSPVEIEFEPAVDALQVGFEDPLDP